MPNHCETAPLPGNSLTYLRECGFIRTFSTICLMMAVAPGRAQENTANHPPTLTVDQSAEGFNFTANLATARQNHTATLLPNGKVLVTGGRGTGSSPYVGNSELYDPVIGKWTPTGSLAVARFSHQATLLHDGTVMVSGGITGGLSNPGTVEIYQPSSGMWTTTAVLSGSWYGHTATLLPDGKVLVAGGGRAEIYTPSSRTWSATSGPLSSNSQHASVLLSNGTVLATGGYTSLFLKDQLFDPVTAKWRTTGSPPMPRRFFQVTLLRDGQVLATGGQGIDTRLDSAERYDPLSGHWSPTSTFSGERSSHTATLLHDGRVLMTGGYDNQGMPVASPHLYDPDRNRWSPISSPTAPRATHTATLLRNGMVLLAGGAMPTGVSHSAELYGPTSEVVGAEGSPVMQHGTFSDADGTNTVSLSASAGLLIPDSAVGKWNWTATGADGPAASTIDITATDTAGNAVNSTYRFIVHNVSPGMDIMAPGGVIASVPATCIFTATDPAEADQAAGFTWSVNFGDGTAVETVAAGTPSPLDLTHTYAFGGTYTISAVATDKDGGTSLTATHILTVSGTTALEAWRQRHFGSPDNLAEGADTFDADKDGLVNLLEFALGLDPTSGASSQLPAARRPSQTLLLTFEQPAEASGCITYCAEWSDSLRNGSWKPVTNFGTHGSHDFRVPSAGLPKMFIRLVVARLTENP